MLKTFIQRPVFTAMLMAAVVVFGLYAYPRIGVDQYPNVDFPVVTVTTILPGADPESIEKTVSVPLEEALSTLNGIDELRSANLESVSQVVISFKLGTNVDTDAQDVRDRVQATLSKLPREIQTPTVAKFDIGAAPILVLSLSGPLPIQELTRIAKDVVKPALQSQTGVGSVDITGGRTRAIQLIVDPSRLRGYGLAISDVSNAVKGQSLDLPGGRTIQGGKERVVRLSAEARSVDELRDLILASPGGAPVHLRDVADVIDGPDEARGSARADHGSAVALTLRKQSGANTVQVAEDVKASLAALNSQLPAGLKLAAVSDNSTFIRSSIHAVQDDMLLGGVLAVLIVFIFLRNLRSTFVVAVALPVSVIGTFAVMSLLGFTFNIITMLALTLSIGLLIDDAIVVIENIVRLLEAGKTPREAALEGASQIAVAVLAVTLSIVAVFIPVAFMTGMIGQFFFQFGVTVAVAVLISYAVSMTLTPMLSSRLLQSHHDQHVNPVSAFVERQLSALEAWYRRVLAKLLAHRAWVMAVAIAVLVGTIALGGLLKFTFMPAQDMSTMRVTVELPIGSTLKQTEATLAEVAGIVRAMPGVKDTFSTAGGGVLEEVQKGEVLVNLVPLAERSFSQEQFQGYLRERLPKRAGVRFGVQENATVGGGRAQQLQFSLRGDDWQQVVAGNQALLALMKKNPGLTDVDSTYRTGKPELDVRIDRDRAAELGVPAAQLGSMLRSYLGRDRFADYREGGQTYDVKLGLAESTLSDADAMGQLTVRNNAGELVELRNLATIVPAEGPVELDRQGQKREILLLANLAPGYSLSEGMTFMTDAAKKNLPSTVLSGFAGRAKELGKTAGAFLTALLLGLILLYMILAAQFESLVHPFTIMMSLPFALIGAIGALLLSGQFMSMFAMIGIIMLMGLVVKNGILVVDFTQQMRATGKNATEALLAAAPMRLRPILMTTIAMIFGMLPVALARGDGAESRVPMALVIIGGLVTSTVLTLVIVPTVYSLIDGVSVRLEARRQRRASSRALPLEASTGAAP